MLLRTFLALALTGALSGCAPSPLLRGSLDTFQAAFAKNPTIERSSAEVEAYPEPQIKLGTPYGEALIVLWRVEDNQQFWGTASRQALVIQHGLVRRTFGFPSNLAGSRFRGPDPFAQGLHLLLDGAECTREVDWQSGNRFGIRLHSRFKRHGLEQVEILGTTHQLLRIDEYAQAEALNLKFTNRYWVSPENGQILHSIQHLEPGLPATLTLLRPYRESAQ